MNNMMMRERGKTVSAIPEPQPSVNTQLDVVQSSTTLEPEGKLDDVTSCRVLVAKPPHTHIREPGDTRKDVSRALRRVSASGSVENRRARSLRDFDRQCKTASGASAAMQASISDEDRSSTTRTMHTEQRSNEKTNTL